MKQAKGRMRDKEPESYSDAVRLTGSLGIKWGGAAMG